MFPSRSAMVPATAATMPGRSGQAKVTTQCVIVLLADKSVVTLTGSRLVVEAAGNQKPAARVAETKSRPTWRRPGSRRASPSTDRKQSDIIINDQNRSLRARATPNDALVSQFQPRAPNN